MVTSDSCSSGHRWKLWKHVRAWNFSTKSYTRLCNLVEPFLRNFQYFLKKGSDRGLYLTFHFYSLHIYNRDERDEREVKTGTTEDSRCISNIAITYKERLIEIEYPAKKQRGKWVLDVILTLHLVLPCFPSQKQPLRFSSKGRRVQKWRQTQTSLYFSYLDHAGG